MEKKILKEVINIDKVAYKEVNFKSKLIEWGQKNRVKLEFGLISQEKDDNGSPKFAYEVVLEGIKGEKGEGYSKKEAQQMASKLTLQRLRKEPQFIDAIFAAKTERTKMEEEPVSVPEEEPSTSEPPSNSPSLGGESKVGKSSLSREALGGSPKQGEPEEVSIDLSLDDITVTPKEQSREDIIAAAEAAAFAEEE